MRKIRVGVTVDASVLYSEDEDYVLIRTQDLSEMRDAYRASVAELLRGTLIDEGIDVIEKLVVNVDVAEVFE